MQIIWNKDNNIKIISDTNTILLNPTKFEKCNIAVDPINVEDFNKINDIFVIF